LKRKIPSKLDVDNTAVRESQINRLNKLKAERNQEEVDRALDALQKLAGMARGTSLNCRLRPPAKRATLGRNLIMPAKK
jgi:methylmalonyl-CoA mutase